jgi:hypothetical protein
MNAIIVDTEKTARECIQYLKDQMIPPQTFLPLDYIQPPSLKERLRTIKSPKGVKLLYDVLRYEPLSIKKAILFVTGNTLICETTEDANHVAYDMDERERYCTVALDGTLYEPSGVMSGGSMDLARKAKRWDDKQLDRLKEKRERLSQELNQAMKNVRKALCLRGNCFSPYSPPKRHNIVQYGENRFETKIGPLEILFSLCNLLHFWKETRFFSQHKIACLIDVEQETLLRKSLGPIH